MKGSMVIQKWIWAVMMLALLASALSNVSFIISLSSSMVAAKELMAEQKKLNASQDTLRAQVDICLALNSRRASRE